MLLLGKKFVQSLRRYIMEGKLIKCLTMAFEVDGALPLILFMYHEIIECVIPQNIETNSLESSVP